MNEKKDTWDKVSIIASVLIPLSIAIIGGIYSWAYKEIEITYLHTQIEKAKINAKVEQARLLQSFVGHLTSDNEYERKIAIIAILSAIPEKGKEIVKVISESDPSKENMEFARMTFEQEVAINSIIRSLEAVCLTDTKYGIESGLNGTITIKDYSPTNGKAFSINVRDNISIGKLNKHLHWIEDDKARACLQKFAGYLQKLHNESLFDEFDIQIELEKKPTSKNKSLTK